MKQSNTRISNATKQTRQTIIDAGLALFHKYGYRATSVRDVAEQAGITKGAFYYHFDSKETLLRLIYQEYFDYQLAIFNEVVTNSMSSREHLCQLITCILLAVERYREHVTIFHQELRAFPEEYQKKVLRERSVIRNEFEKVIMRGIESGEFRQNIDVSVTSIAILGMCSWSYQWLSRSGRYSAEQIAEHFCRLVLDGVGLI